MDTWVWIGALLALGFLSWGALEYVIHGFLSHWFRTPVSPMHWGHHENPRAVFTSPVAWVPIAITVYGVTAWAIGWLFAAAWIGGLLIGFARYEWIHWRIHFRAPRNDRERLLRSHHLAHHYRNPRMYHGVTTRLYDRIFGTLPADHEADYRAVADKPVLSGESNLAASWNPRTAVARIRELRAQPAEARRGRPSR